MEHFYKNIDGWFDFEEVYDIFVKEAKNGATIVEVGAWLGMSTAYLAVESINSRKNIRLHVVDTFKGSLTEHAHIDFIGKNNGSVLNLFLRNVEPVLDSLALHIKDSFVASNFFKDNSIDFLFLDSDHRFDFVLQELEHWFPKVKKGGIIAGHDWTTFPSVQEAVKIFFREQEENFSIEINKTSWLVRKS